MPGGYRRVEMKCRMDAGKKLMINVVGVYLSTSLLIFYFLKSSIMLRVNAWLTLGAAMSVTALALVGYDKLISKSGGKQTRLPEQSLILIGIFGGAVGVIAGMELCRHKTKKQGLRIAIACIAVAEVLVVGYLTRMIG